MQRSCIKCGSTNIQEVVQDNKTLFYCAVCKVLDGRVNDPRYGRDITIPTDTGIKHLSVGALIRKDDKYLLIKRRNWPFGYSFPSGHVEYKEEIEDALRREILEETALEVAIIKLLFKGEINEQCRYGADIHVWHFYECTPKKGVPILNSESESLGWYSYEEMTNLELVPAAKILLDKALVNETRK
jgi:nucleoside triphosphatase